MTDTLTTAPPRQETPPAGVEDALFAIVEATLRELHAGDPNLPPVTPDSMLDRDLGFDSLGRMELLLRTERAFGIDLPADTLQSAETVGDLLRAVQRGTAVRDTSGSGAANAPPPLATLDAPKSAPARPDTHADSNSAQPGAPQGATTLLEVLAWHVRAHPEQTQVVYLQDDTEQRISYRQLSDASAAVAAGLQRAGIVPRQSVAIMLPTSPEYFSSYLGILMAGAIPVPIYPPARASQLEDHVLRHTGILANAGTVMLVTVTDAMIVARLLQAHVAGLRQVTTPQQLVQGQGVPTPVAVRGDDIAFIQYTSGSTGNPKGVALTHANLLANIRAMAQAIEATPRDVFVSWLPLYHDMGLIGAWLAPLYVGFPLVVMSPLAFLAKPLRWLQAMHRWRGTLSAGPNFSYELCLKRIDDAALAGLDLSAWRLAFNGAEAVSPDTVRHFAERFAACGLRAEAVAPVYGLAETSVGLLFPPLGRVAPIDAIQREPFTRERRAVPAAPEDASALRFVACGRPLPCHAVRIVDDNAVEVGERIEGQLEFQGPSATHGYFRNPDQTAKLLHDGWLDSGDRAYRANGDIYITGRVKDIVIRGGRNLYPQEIEEVVGQLDGIRKGCVAVFGSPDPATGTERLVVLAEVRAVSAEAKALLREAVSSAVINAIGEPPDEIVLARPHTVLKTSSGKVRRSACRSLFEVGGVGAAPVSTSQQMLRLALGALLPRLRQLGRAAGRAMFGLWAALLFWFFAPLTWLLTLLMPNPAAAWALGGIASRTLFRLTGTPLTVDGLDNVPTGPCVLVSNHASYLDGVILVAALPRQFVFVAKRELQSQFIARQYLERLGAEFVERFEVQRSVLDAGRMAEAVQQGRSLVFFPEGTFVARPGLLPFHLGAFLAAARAGVPVVPVAIQGHRDILPADRWWPRPGALQVEVCAPIVPASNVTLEAPDLFATAVKLREAARTAIARRLDAAKC
ncbi:MAG: AMP-binding protein [Burkholderiaceae bacterium]|nr:AMP-binding protein [Burkholderiaceae bacterium]